MSTENRAAFQIASPATALAGRTDNHFPVRTCYLISTPVAPLGHPVAGGVTVQVKNSALAALEFAERVCIFAPRGSTLSLAGARLELREVDGGLHVPAQERQAAPPPDSALAAMLDLCRHDAGAGDVVVSFAYDAMAFEATKTFSRAPLFHYVTMALSDDGMGEVIAATARQYPHRLAMLGRAQAAVFAPDLPVALVPLGFDMALYDFNPQPQPLLGWAGRISPDKDVGRAMSIAGTLAMKLRIMGQVIDEAYWEDCLRSHPQLDLEITGFLDTRALQAKLGECAAFLMVPRWLEAFGNVVIEAQACGVPVVCYHECGPAEITRDGLTGVHVARGDEPGLASATRRALALDRAACRKHAESEYGLPKFKMRFHDWLAPSPK